MPGYYVVSHHGTRPLGHCGRALPPIDWSVDMPPGVYVQLPSDSSATSGSDLSAMVPSEMPRALSSPVISLAPRGAVLSRSVSAPAVL